MLMKFRKHFFYIFLLLFFREVSFAQTPYHPFPEDTARWSLREDGQDALGIPYINTLQYKMYGDTVIETKSYNKIFTSKILEFQDPSDSLHCFIRQDTALKHVYARFPYNTYHDSSDILIYDFSLQVGDTFNIKLITDGSIHQTVVQSSGDSTATNIDYRRLIFLHCIEPFVWGPGCDGSFSWMEGIGYTQTFLYTEIPLNYCSDHGLSTECFLDKGTYVFGGTWCDFSTEGIKEKKSIKQPSLHPNPVVNQSRLELGNYNNPDKIFIVNSLGVRAATFSDKNPDILNISSSDFSSGLYIFVLIKGKELYTIKFTVLN